MSDLYDKLTKKQHFVSQFYLRSWCREDGKLSVYMNDKIQPMHPSNVAHARFFYKIQNLNISEYRFIQFELNKFSFPDEIKILFQSIIDQLFLLGIFQDDFGIKPPIEYESEVNKMENVKKNFLENYYGIVESLVSVGYRKILSESYSDFNLEDYDHMIRHITYQLGRTVKVRENVERSSKEELLKNKIRFENWYPISMVLTSEIFHMNLVEKVYVLNIIENKTDIKFITNDNPVYNLSPISNHERVDLYFPLSPDKAVILSPSEDEESLKEITKHEVMNGKFNYSKFIKVKKEYSQEKIKNYNKIIWDNRNRFCISAVDDGFPDEE